ncbi:M50 family metallopeptidase [Bacillaceae bacterium W0354]
MKSNLIQLHPLMLLFMVLSYFLGLFTELLSFFIIITIHELGHLVAAKYYNWNISRLVIWPFGGVMETEDYYNRPSREELIVTLAGPFQHLWIYLCIYLLKTSSFESLFIEQLLFANTVILLFNLLPILPLDGGRIIFLIISKFSSFHHSIAWMSMLSIALIATANIAMYIYGWYGIHFTFLSIFLILDNWLTWKNKHVFLLKHLLARYFMSNIERSNINVLRTSPDTLVSELVKQFKKECYHYIYLGDKQYPISEDDCLKALFTKNDAGLTLAKIEGS